LHQPVLLGDQHSSVGQPIDGIAGDGLIERRCPAVAVFAASQTDPRRSGIRVNGDLGHQQTDDPDTDVCPSLNDSSVDVDRIRINEWVGFFDFLRQVEP